MSPTVQDLDMYEESRKFPLVYDPAADPVVIAEMELMAQEATKLASRKNGAVDSETDSDVEERGSDEDDSSETESESDSDDEWVEVDDSRPKPPKGKGSKPKKPKKAFTPVDKVFLHYVSRMYPYLPLYRFIMSPSIYCAPKSGVKRFVD